MKKILKEKVKKFRLINKDNKIIFLDINNNYYNNEDNDKEKELVDKIKVIFKKGKLDDNIVYEISIICKD